MIWARPRPRISTLVGRFANLYGPGQRLDKPQGLISHISRCSLFAVPVHIYVSLDTIRDYLFAADAGHLVVTGLDRLARERPEGGLHIKKVYSSEQGVSVARLVGVFQRIARRQLRVVSGLHSVSAQQPLQLTFRSVIWRDEPSIPRTDLVEGVTRVHQHQLSLFRAGILPAPPPLARSKN